MTPTDDTLLSVTVTPPPVAGPASRAAGMLLRIADGYRERNALRQAIEAYFSLLANYGHLPEAARARERLMTIAEGYEAKGEYRSARALCERLL